MAAQKRGILNLIAGGALSEAHEAAGDLFRNCARAGMQVGC